MEEEKVEAKAEDAKVEESMEKPAENVTTPETPQNSEAPKEVQTEKKPEEAVKPAEPVKKSGCLSCWVIGIVILVILMIGYYIVSFFGFISNPLFGIMSLFR
jgi:ATP-dependent Zn protease